MRFDLSDEQSDLERHARDFFGEARDADLEAVLGSKPVADPGIWGQLAGELGLAGIAVAEDDGGAGGNLVDLAVVLDAAGYALSTQPLLASAGCAVAALQAGRGDRAKAWLGDLATGALVGTWANPGDLAEPVIAERMEDGWRLRGRVTQVVCPDRADLFLVVAQTGGEEQVFGVRRTAPGLHMGQESALDPTRPLATISLDGAEATPAHAEVDAAALSRARSVAVVLLAAELAGVARGAFDVAVAYARDREQFGRAIGSFQAVKHLLADMFVDVETARDVARYGVWSLDADADAPEELAAMTHAHVSACSIRVTASMLQVLGGIGYTWEHPAHLYYKRALSSARLFTTVDRELDRLAARVGLGEAP
ncbi:acyl-CoA dehydrogenase family protein [Streptomyces sp. NPDC096310]|uniref:acyl-CoA dehydrogenase family protein n=1 Tax=Streptomyces sp. NPDC096310 TaxID=3366082 RepID=UPI00381D6238